jgi:division/cell wall cluster transcriptional repressor MraZ
MSDFLGTYYITMEESGRIRLPGDFADEFKELAILTYGDRPCIEIYPPDSWKNMAEDFSKQPKPWPAQYEWQVRQKTRSYKEAEIKGKGRLTVPKEHRAFARLRSDEDCLVIGMLDHLEIWAQDQYKDAEEDHRAQQKYGR